MLISLNWISDYVDLEGVNKEELIHQFSLSTAEVENEIFYMGSQISGIVVGKIISVENHPESQKLHLLKVDYGAETPANVVCGAPNVREGMKTAFATLGAQVGEITIAPRKLAGYVSEGMCCSEKELGLSDDHSGIMDITEDVALGTDLKDLYEIEDIVFEVDNKSLTNRPDLWGHYGIAREIAALLNRPLKEMPVVDLTKYESLPKLDMKIEDSICQRYSCMQIENVQKNVSPMNMRIRLFYCGMRGINLLADLTNYLMLDLGQPMHAFDSRKVEKLRIKRFAAPFTFTTLDGVDRQVDENTLMICNGDTPVAIAGIMGGLDSEIVEDTTQLTLESATFDAASIRKSTVKLAHRTDASARYEKSLDPEMTTTAIARFIKLLLEIDPGVQVVSSLTDEYPHKYPVVELEFDKEYVDRYTGIDISMETISQTLKALGFAVELAGESCKVVVPSWRATKDVTIKADIIEEITRIYGYDNFDVNTTYVPLYPVRIPSEKSLEDQLKDILVKQYAMHEVHSYIWMYYDEYKKLGIEVENNIKLLNASNPNIETIRNSIVPTQLCQLKYNIGQSQDFSIFEIGRVVKGLKEDGLCDEHKMLSITSYSRERSLETMFFALRDVVGVLLDETKHQKLRFKKMEAEHSYEHPKNLYSIWCGEVCLGRIGQVHPVVLSKLDKKANVVFCELDVKAIDGLTYEEIHYEEPSKFPGIDMDLTFVANRFAEIEEEILAENCPLIKGISVVDVYVENGQKAITTRIQFALNERTLTKEEVMVYVEHIVARLKDKGIVQK